MQKHPLFLQTGKIFIVHKLSTAIHFKRSELSPLGLFRLLLFEGFHLFQLESHDWPNLRPAAQVWAMYPGQWNLFRITVTHFRSWTHDRVLYKLTWERKHAFYSHNHAHLASNYSEQPTVIWQHFFCKFFEFVHRYVLKELLIIKLH